MKGSILKRKNSWRLKWDIGANADGTRQTRYKTVRGTEKDAERELRKILSSLDNGTYVEQKKSTVGQWMHKWLSDYAKPSVSAKTFQRYEEISALHIEPYIGHLPIQKLNPPTIQGLYTKLRTEGLKPRRQMKANGELSEAKPARGLSERTILHVHRLLSNAMSEAARALVIQRNPVKDVKGPRPNNRQAGVSEKMHALERDQLTKVLQGFKGHSLFPLVSLAAGTGARRGELLALRWSDVDFEKGKIQICRATEEVSGLVRINSEPKNKSSIRPIGIDPGLLALLKSHKKSHIEVQFALDGKRLPADALVFPLSPLTPGLPIRPSNVSTAFAGMVKKLGFKGFRFHDLRHTHATLLLNANVPVNTVAQRLGHSTPTITLSVYGHCLRRSEDEAVAVAGAMLAGALHD
jgi:integrase